MFNKINKYITKFNPLINIVLCLIPFTRMEYEYKEVYNTRFNQYEHKWVSKDTSYISNLLIEYSNDWGWFPIIAFIFLSIIIIIFLILNPYLKNKKTKINFSSLILSIILFFLVAAFSCNLFSNSSGYGIDRWTDVFGEVISILNFVFAIIGTIFSTYSLIKLIKFNNKENILNKLGTKDLNGFIVINCKNSKVYIRPETNELFYKDDKININEITDVELVNKSKIVERSGMAEAIVAGVLFGSLGAVAGAYAGKREKNVEDFKVVFKTSNVYHSTIFISASYENCIKIADTVFLIRKKLAKKEE